jgi:large subunit ribosomal protein L17
MRHGISGNKFGRNQKLRQATIRDLVRAVLKFEVIKTTLAKAIEARKVVDKMITLGKSNTLAAKRRAYALLCDHAMVSNLFDIVAPRFANRNGGYTRIIKFFMNRQGDNAQMALLELTERQPVTDLAGEDKSLSSSVKDAEVVEPKDKKKTVKKIKVDSTAKKVSEKSLVKKPVVKKTSAKKLDKA